MTIALSPLGRRDEWLAVFRAELPDHDIRLWPDLGEPDEIHYAIAWAMPPQALAAMTNLRAILSLGAGTEQWQQPGMPDVPVVRLADPAMSDDMAAYCLAWVIRHQRRFVDCERAQSNGEWHQIDFVDSDRFGVGVLGYGTIGRRIGEAFLALGYRVNAWTRTERDVGEAHGFVGPDGLRSMLGASDALINVLPATADTIGLLDSAALSKVPEGALFVNIGRGNVLAGDEVLVTALDSGPLGAAVLDVTEPEPLPPTSPLWRHPGVIITPHISGITRLSTAAGLIAANVRRLEAGEAAFPLLDRVRGY